VAVKEEHVEEEEEEEEDDTPEEPRRDRLGLVLAPARMPASGPRVALAAAPAPAPAPHHGTPAAGGLGPAV
jgi:hypothetical protein